MSQTDPSSDLLWADDHDWSTAINKRADDFYLSHNHTDHLVKHPHDDSGDYLYDPVCHVLVRRTIKHYEQLDVDQQHEYVQFDDNDDPGTGSSVL